MRFLLLGLVTFLSITSVARAEQFQIDGQTLSISPPESYCLLDRSRNDDAELMILLGRSQEGVNRVLLRTAAEGALPALLPSRKAIPRY